MSFSLFAKSIWAFEKIRNSLNCLQKLTQQLHCEINKKNASENKNSDFCHP